MPINAIVRTSFQASPPANQAVNFALVGHAQNPVGPGPFQRVGTAAFVVNGGSDATVGLALANLGAAVSAHSASLDFLSVSVVRV